MRKPGIYFVIISYSVVLILGGCNADTTPGDKETLPQNSTSRTETTEVSTVTADKRTFEYLISSNGKVISLNDQLVICESGGRLTASNAKTGKSFSTGAMIAQFETTPILYKLERAKLAVFNNTKEYESQLLGYENLLKDKTREEAEIIQKKLRISTGLAGAEQDIKEANYELAKATVRAPFSGILADVKIQKSQFLTPGQEMFRIYDPGNLLLQVKVLEADISMIKTGTTAEVSPIAEPDIKLAAAVYEINPYIDENGMVTVKLRINKKAGPHQQTVLPGMNCTAIIKIPFAKALLIPRDAVVMRTGKPVVFTAENGVAKWNYVVTGRENGKEVEIREGLKEGAQVIVTNNLQLAHDSPVKIINGKTAEN